MDSEPSELWLLSRIHYRSFEFRLITILQSAAPEDQRRLITDLINSLDPVAAALILQLFLTYCGDMAEVDIVQPWQETEQQQNTP